jgi:hypothetical protein
MLTITSKPVRNEIPLPAHRGVAGVRLLLGGSDSPRQSAPLYGQPAKTSKILVLTSQYIKHKEELSCPKLRRLYNER